jgi:hypothetical protein
MKAEVAGAKDWKFFWTGGYFFGCKLLVDVELEFRGG